MQGQPACRAGEPSGQGEEPPPEGLGGGYPLSQTDPRRPAGQVVGHRLDGQPGAVGGEAARGEMVQPDAVLEVAYGILDLGVAAMVSLQFEQLPVPVGDEAMIAVFGEEGQLGTGRRLHPPDDEPYRRGVRLGLEGGAGGLGHIGGAVHPVRNRRPGIFGYRLDEIVQAFVLLGRSTVRRILVGAGMASPRRRRPPLHRVRRQRMSQEGMLVQVDGSVHAWLEERGPRCTLLLAIDDATSTVPYALFRHEEDTHGYFLLMQELIRRCGVPLALYSDRHAVFKYVPGSHQSPAPTQFGRAMAELGVEQIFARSPEAKGRVERANGTFQDRLVTELRLAGARTISEANQVLWAFLTRFNKRFGVPPAQSTNAYRSPDPDLNLAGILCFKHSRKVARDNTVKYNWHTLQLLPSSERSTYVGAHVVVQERLDGKLVVQHH